MMGRQYHVKSIINNNNIVLDVSSLKSGIYIYRFVDKNEKVISGRFLKIENK
jgi:hypothetical protein